MWKTVKLGDVCHVKRGTTITKKDVNNGSVPVIGGGIKPTYFHNKANRKENCITISSSGANAGYVNLWEEPIFASDCSTVEPKDNNVLNKFIYYNLRYLHKYIYVNLRRGAAQPHVYAKDVAELYCILPPLEEQKEIVKKLDAAFAEIDKNIENLKNKKGQVESLVNRILEEELKNAEGENLKLGDVCDIISGQSPESNYYNKEMKGTPFYQGSKDFGDKYLNPPRVWTTKIYKKAFPNDVLISVRAPVGDLNIAKQEICIGRGLAAIRVREKVDLDFLFNSLQILVKDIENKSGAVFNSINRKILEQLLINLPSLEEQKQIARKLAAINLEKDSSINAINSQIDNYIALKSSILSNSLKSPSL